MRRKRDFVDCYSCGVEHRVPYRGGIGYGGRFPQGFGTVGACWLRVFHKPGLQMGMIQHGGELIIKEVAVEQFPGFGIVYELLIHAVTYGHAHAPVNLACRRQGINELSAVVAVNQVKEFDFPEGNIHFHFCEGIGRVGDDVCVTAELSFVLVDPT